MPEERAKNRSAEHWQKVKKLCFSALEQEFGKQAQFLDEACAGDESLRREIDSLLVQYKKAKEESFLSSPEGIIGEKTVVELAEHFFDEQSQADRQLIGRRLGEFIIREKLGEGGFGAVYLADQPT